MNKRYNCKFPAETAQKWMFLALFLATTDATSSILIGQHTSMFYWLRPEVGKSDDIKSVYYTVFSEALFQLEKRLGGWTGA